MENLHPPDSFDFPFPPYDIQHNFMKSLFETLENRKFGIFESPTGTGKSLSIICGALRWLKDRNHDHRATLASNIAKLIAEKSEISSESSDWIESQAVEIQINHRLNGLKAELGRIEAYDRKIGKLREKSRAKVLKKFARKVVSDGGEEKAMSETSKEEDGDDLLLDDEAKVDEEEEDVEEEQYRPIKIYICSRTHSQLSQFVGEIIKSPFGKDTRVVTLASRQNYCINPAVSSLKNVALINERCLDLQKSQSKPTKQQSDGKILKRQKPSVCKCPYFKPQAIEDLKDSVLSDIQDIEDLLSTAKEIKACPYYASRKAVEDAEVVLVPYNTILHKPTREANGIRLKDNIVIIDEAHNLLEAMAQMYGSEVNHNQLVHSHLQLKAYKTRYNTRLSANNLLCINQLIYVIKCLIEELDKPVKQDSKVEIVDKTSFVWNAGFDNYNMFNLLKFVKDSKISQKLHGFALKHSTEPQLEPQNSKSGIKSFLTSIENKKIKPQPEPPEPLKQPKPPSNPLLAVTSFLETLTYPEEDGRILIHRTEHKKLQFLLLNPSMHFKDLVEQARSIVVAGGTMKPISEFRQRLFVNAGAAPDRIVEFSCDHIIPPSNILPIVVTTGKHNEQLLFNYENRLKMGGNVKAVLFDACRRVKGGVVVFFPSYQYESWVWEQVKQVDFGRPVFREPQGTGAVDAVLEGYQKAVCKSEKRAAIMFSVVGGKLSEGLNFSDDLGRCVIVVGLPYANIYAPDLKEKMFYLDKKEGFGSGNRFYESLCMKSVNQCIGRAVRHRNDYATVLLLDERFNRKTTKESLPEWIRRSLQVCTHNEAFSLIDKFFADKQQV